jgi:hypothetical protein
MESVSRDQELVARAEIALSFAFNAETGGAGEQQYPLVMSLPMRLIHRRGLASRDNSLDTHTLS